MNLEELKEKLNINEISNEIDELIHILISNLECDIDVSFRKGITYLDIDGRDSLYNNPHTNCVFPLFDIKESDRKIYEDTFLKYLPKSKKIKLYQLFSLSISNKDFDLKVANYMDSYFKNMNRIGYYITLVSGGKLTTLEEILKSKNYIKSFDLKVSIDLDVDLAKSILIKKESKIYSFKDYKKFY